MCACVCGGECVCVCVYVNACTAICPPATLSVSLSFSLCSPFGGVISIGRGEGRQFLHSVNIPRGLTHDGNLSGRVRGGRWWEDAAVCVSLSSKFTEDENGR